MADVAESKPAEAVEQKTEETTTNGVSEKPAEANGDEKEVNQEANGDGKSENKKQDYSRDREQHDRKRRGSFNNDRRGGGRGRGRGRGDAFRSRGGGRQNKSRFEDLPESNDETEIRRQVDFYFSDSNLPIDAYLLRLTGGRENKPVPLKTIHDFKRMRHFQPYSAVRNAVANSSFLDLNDNDEITRKVPIDEKYSNSDVQYNKDLAQTSSMARSIYVKGFPEESERTQLDLEEFFEAYGPIQAVRLRRHDDGLFKGSVFVEFETEDLQKAFLELDPKPTFDDKELKIMSKSEYVDNKNEDIKEGRVKPRSPSRRGGYKGGNFGKDDWRERREHDQRGGGRNRGGKRGGRGGGRQNNARDRSRSGSPNDRFGRQRRENKERSRSPAEVKEEVKHPNSNELAGEKKTKTESEQIEEAAKAGAEAGNAEPSKKRTRQDGDDGEAEKGEAKKAKEEQASSEA